MTRRTTRNAIYQISSSCLVWIQLCLVMAALLATVTSLSNPHSNPNRSVKRIALLTSGGDCPSLNACIRAIVQSANNQDIEVIGLPIGLPGLLIDPKEEEMRMREWEMEMERQRQEQIQQEEISRARTYASTNASVGVGVGVGVRPPRNGPRPMGSGDMNDGWQSRPQGQGVMYNGNTNNSNGVNSINGNRNRMHMNDNYRQVQRDVNSNDTSISSRSASARYNQQRQQQQQQQQQRVRVENNINGRRTNNAAAANGFNGRTEVPAAYDTPTNMINTNGDSTMPLPQYKAFKLDDTYTSTDMLTKGGSRLGGYAKGDFALFDTLSLPEKAVRISEALKNLEIDGVIATGGDSSLDRISTLLEHMKYIVDAQTGLRIQPLPFVGIPKTIDNDIPSTIYSLGFQSAVTSAASAIVDARTTAESHRRVMVVECMGREAGFLALHAGLAGGADAILLPEFGMDEHVLLSHISKVHREKKCAVICVSEATKLPGKYSNYRKVATHRTPDGSTRFGGSGEAIAKFIADSLKLDARHIVLGHLQRGAAPNAFDRTLSTVLGTHAVKVLCEKGDLRQRREKYQRRQLHKQMMYNEGRYEYEEDVYEEEDEVNGQVLDKAMRKEEDEGGVFVTWDGRNVQRIPLKDISGVDGKTVTADYPELVAAQALGIYCGNTIVQ
mmetsp:Transcript_19533/g.29580  ORF Transcript_19533/g.29580 Transcript_19533/m.29580 type:complete len:669 (-) Transcript_19533:77-2083(-)